MSEKAATKSVATQSPTYSEILQSSPTSQSEVSTRNTPRTNTPLTPIKNETSSRNETPSKGESSSNFEPLILEGATNQMTPTKSDPPKDFETPLKLETDTRNEILREKEDPRRTSHTQSERCPSKLDDVKVLSTPPKDPTSWQTVPGKFVSGKRYEEKISVLNMCNSFCCGEEGIPHLDSKKKRSTRKKKNMKHTSQNLFQSIIVDGNDIEAQIPAKEEQKKDSKSKGMAFRVQETAVKSLNYVKETYKALTGTKSEANKYLSSVEEIERKSSDEKARRKIWTVSSFILLGACFGLFAIFALMNIHGSHGSEFTSGIERELMMRLPWKWKKGNRCDIKYSQQSAEVSRRKRTKGDIKGVFNWSPLPEGEKRDEENTCNPGGYYTHALKFDCNEKSERTWMFNPRDIHSIKIGEYLVIQDVYQISKNNKTCGQRRIWVRESDGQVFVGDFLETVFLDGERNPITKRPIMKKEEVTRKKRRHGDTKGTFVWLTERFETIPKCTTKKNETMPPDLRDDGVYHFYSLKFETSDEKDKRQWVIDPRQLRLIKVGKYHVIQGVIQISATDKAACGQKQIWVKEDNHGTAFVNELMDTTFTLSAPDDTFKPVPSFQYDDITLQDKTQEKTISGILELREVTDGEQTDYYLYMYQEGKEKNGPTTAYTLFQTRDLEYDHVGPETPTLTVGKASFDIKNAFALGKESGYRDLAIQMKGEQSDLMKKLEDNVLFTKYRKRSGISRRKRVKRLLQGDPIGTFRWSDHGQKPENCKEEALFDEYTHTLEFLTGNPKTERKWVYNAEITNDLQNEDAKYVTISGVYQISKNTKACGHTDVLVLRNDVGREFVEEFFRTVKGEHLQQDHGREEEERDAGQEQEEVQGGREEEEQQDASQQEVTRWKRNGGSETGKFEWRKMKKGEKPIPSCKTKSSGNSFYTEATHRLTFTSKSGTTRNWVFKPEKLIKGDPDIKNNEVYHEISGFFQIDKGRACGHNTVKIQYDEEGGLFEEKITKKSERAFQDDFEQFSLDSKHNLGQMQQDQSEGESPPGGKVHSKPKLLSQVAAQNQRAQQEQQQQQQPEIPIN